MGTDAVSPHSRHPGSLYVGKDTHALSGPAPRTALEALSANEVETMIKIIVAALEVEAMR